MYIQLIWVYPTLSKIKYVRQNLKRSSNQDNQTHNYHILLFVWFLIDEANNNSTIDRTGIKHFFILNFMSNSIPEVKIEKNNQNFDAIIDQEVYSQCN